MSQAPTEHSSLVEWDPMPLLSPEDPDPAPPMTPLLLGLDETTSSSGGEEEEGSSDEEEGDGAPTSKQPQSQKQGPHPYLQGAWAVQVNLFTALAGPTCFAMPWAFQEAGLLAGPLGVVMVAVLSYFTVCILISSKRRLMQRASALGSSGSITSLYNSGLDHSYDPSPLPPLSSSTGLGGLRHLTYAQIASRALGRRASVLIKVATCLSCLGACAAYATFTAGLITQLLPSLAQSTVLLYLLPVFIGLSWIRSFKQMAFFNIMGNLSLVLGVVMLLYDGLRVSSSPPPPPPHHHGHHAPPPPPVLPLVSPSTLLLFFGPTTFLFTIHYCAVPIESEMAHPSDFPWLLAAAVFAMAVIDIAVGLAGLMFYGRGQLVRDPTGRVLPGCEKPVCDNVLKNIGPGGLKTAMSLLFSVNLLFTYAIMLAPPREYLERWIFRKPRVRRRVSSKALFSHNPSSQASGGTGQGEGEGGSQQAAGEGAKVGWWSERRSRRWRKNLFRALLVLFTFGVALGVGEFGMLIAFVGGITDALQGFVLPPLIHRATHWTSLGSLKRRMLLALAFLGLSLMLSATYQNGLAFQAIRQSQATQQLEGAMHVLLGYERGQE